MTIFGKLQMVKFLFPRPHQTLRRNLMFAAHLGVSGHCGVETTFKQLEEVVFWENMYTDI